MALRDVTHPIETGMPVFPGDPTVSVEEVADLEQDGYRVSAINCGSHTGTHIDAPSHTIPGGGSIDDYPVNRFVFDVRVVDVRGIGAREPIPPDALPDEDGACEMVVFRTGWDDFWGQERYFDHPYLAVATAQRCVEAGWSIGVDTLNPDPTPTENASEDEPEGFPVHHSILGNDRFIIENLTNLGGLGQGTLYAFPMALQESDGAPIRAVIDTERV